VITQSPFRFRLDNSSGVPVYRQLIDQVQAGIATGSLSVGHQIPTVRQVAVDLAINPNTVMRAYRELEIRGVLDTQQGTGTFIATQRPQIDNEDRVRRLDQLIDEFVARAGAGRFTLAEILDALKERGK
jgi:DNA-binding transcriptional regulator YhcF (GntR family)